MPRPATGPRSLAGPGPAHHRGERSTWFQSKENGMRRTGGLLDRLGVSMLFSAALLCVAAPVWAEGTPPIIRFFGAWAEMRPTFLEPHLFLDVQVDDPDGQVPATIQSVIVTGPDERTYDLTSRFSHPNLTFRGEYFFDAGSPVQT